MVGKRDFRLEARRLGVDLADFEKKGYPVEPYG